MKRYKDKLCVKCSNYLLGNERLSDRCNKCLDKSVKKALRKVR
jgi:hypothetical protein